MRDEFHPLPIAAVRRETADAVSFALAVPDALREMFRHRPGQHLVVRAMLDGAEVRRTYSISSDPADRELWITIKRVDGGLFSTHAHERLAAGATIEAMRPAGRFVVPDDGGNGRSYLAIAAGSGITPVMAQIRHVLASEPGSSFTLIYGNRSVDSIIFREALEDLKDCYLGRLSVLHVLSRDTEADVPLLSGRIDGDKVRRLLPLVAGSGGIDQVYLCGPGDLIKTARDALLAAGVARERIHFEYFRAGPEPAQRRLPAARASEVGATAGAEVIVIVDGTRHAFRVTAGGLVVDAAVAAGVRVPYSCKGGMCCTCRAKLVEGQVDMVRNFSLERWEIEAGFVLTCQAQPRSSRVVLDYDAM
ncbi:MAG TPA: 2Fe-2S iron-sulfur cluster-binding protein [Hyphomicrobiaceae bacterium]|nr:2Fe-2S iron-sulfur cluster-binding protein [Hyphomicrobiaceae bacterium]